MSRINWRRFVAPLGLLALLVLAWNAGGWAGLALVGSGLVMCVLLYLSRLFRVLNRAAARPLGYVESAVMFNAKLHRGMPLLRVLAMTRALGEPRSPEGQQPELFRWTDDSRSWVDAEFHQGRLARWTLSRPAGSEVGGAEGNEATSSTSAAS